MNKVYGHCRVQILEIWKKNLVDSQHLYTNLRNPVQDCARNKNPEPER